MRLLMIASGYLPYMFSENLCNGKLVMALKHEGIEVDVISKVDEGPTYSDEWVEPWSQLKDTAYTVRYKTGNKLIRTADILFSGIRMDWEFQAGIRWTRRAYDMALKMIRQNTYDAILTRSPGDMAHLAGYKLHKKTGIRWIANWNDPAAPIWPEPYTHHFSPKEQAAKMKFTEKMLRAADINTFPSDSLRKHFISHFPFLAELPTKVIPHIALEENLFPAPSHDLKSYDGLRMLHSGNLSRERDPELTFKAIRELIDEGYQIEFHIMGRVNDYTENLIVKYGLRDNVKCIGSFPYLEALSKMQEYDVLVLLEAKLKKGIFFASKFTDYAQCHKPILAISPKDGFAHETIEQYGGGLFADNNDYKDIKDKIISLYKDRSINSTLLKSILFNQFYTNSVIKIYKEII